MLIYVFDKIFITFLPFTNIYVNIYVLLKETSNYNFNNTKSYYIQIESDDDNFMITPPQYFIS